MSDQPATRGPEYNWRMEAEHYQKECDELRNLLSRIEANWERSADEHDQLRAENERLNNKITIQECKIVTSYSEEAYKKLQVKLALYQKAFPIMDESIFDSLMELEGLANHGGWSDQNAVLSHAKLGHQTTLDLKKALAALNGSAGVTKAEIVNALRKSSPLTRDNLADRIELEGVLP